MRRMNAEFHQRYAAGTARHAIEFLADPHALARAEQMTGEMDYPYTCGAAIAHVGMLLDALGYPEQGPSVDQWSWLPVDEDEDEDEMAGVS